jgi:hypothetical protein
MDHKTSRFGQDIPPKNITKAKGQNLGPWYFRFDVIHIQAAIQNM